MKRGKHSGFTLIEMIVAFAVLGVATLGIGGFFVSAARSYSSVSDETSLQYEAQFALNQVENMLIDSTLGVSYNYVTTSDESITGYKFVEKDADATGTAVSKVLYAFNVNETDGSKIKLLLMKWVAADNSIYYKEIQADRTIDKVSEINIAGLNGWDLLAEDVRSFSVDLSEYDKTKKIALNLGFENRSKDYQTSGTVVLRNNVLINEDSIGKIYEQITQVIKSTITGVEISANTNVTVPGGAVQLKARVTGTGYPSQDIYQWIVASDPAFTNVIYDSLYPYEYIPSTYIDTNSLVLYVSDDTTGAGSAFNETLYVQAVVKTTNDENEVIYYKDDLSIGVKMISNISVSVNADTNLSQNSNLVNVGFEVATLQDQKKESPVYPSMVLQPENIVYMEAAVTGSDNTLTDADKAINWSIVGKTAGVIADIDNTGRLEINQYSKTGSFTVRASLRLDSTVFVDYNVVVGTQYDSNAELEIKTSKSNLNRGGSLTTSLTLNGTPVDNKDYDFTISVVSSTGEAIGGNPVIVNGEGGIFANYDLSYDYSYIVRVNASLKSNPDIYTKTPAVITIPKVSLSLSPLTKYSSMGSTVDGITCTAIGLEEYDIKWAMAKDTNPNYFYTAWGSSNITGSKNSEGAGTAVVVLGKTTDPMTNFTVKASLKDNANYSATMNIRTAIVKISITGGTSVSRNSSLNLDVKLDSSNSNVSVSKYSVDWEITNVKIGGSSYPELIDETISIEDGKLTVGQSFAEDYTDREVVVYVRAYDENLGIEDEHIVTISAAKVELYPNMVLIPDLSPATTIQYKNYSGATWSLTNGDSNVSINSSTGLLSAKANANTSNANKTYTVRLKIGNTNYTGYMRYGFETVSSYTTTKEETYSNYGTNYKRQYNIRKSDYYVLKDGEFCPVYYVQYNLQQRTSSGGGNRPGRPGSSTTRWQTIETHTYAFVANSATDKTNGQWYEFTKNYYNNNGTWKTSSAPSNWKATYLN